MNAPTIVIIAALSAVVIAIVIVYNSFVSLSNKVEEAFALMDVYLKKRFDLIPTLVEVVKGYMAHETSTLEGVVNERAKASDRNTQLSAESNISNAINNIIVIAEKYPDLKANNSFLDIQSQLVALEDDIANARKYYNGSIRIFNTKIQTFPNNLFASIFGFKAKNMFEANTEERKTVSVEL